VKIGKYQKYGKLLKNSIESYPLRDKIVLVMKDMVWVKQAFDAFVIVKVYYFNPSLLHKFFRPFKCPGFTDNHFLNPELDNSATAKVTRH
jgi:hypothetical protein